LLYVQSFWHRMILSDSDEAAQGIYEAIDWSANRVILPAAVVVLAAGITMVAVNDAWASRAVNRSPVIFEGSYIAHNACRLRGSRRC
jgi:hypothetical protein